MPPVYSVIKNVKSIDVGTHTFECKTFNLGSANLQCDGITIKYIKIDAIHGAFKTEPMAFAFSFSLMLRPGDSVVIYTPYRKYEGELLGVNADSKDEIKQIEIEDDSGDRILINLGSIVAIRLSGDEET